MKSVTTVLIALVTLAMGTGVFALNDPLSAASTRSHLVVERNLCAVEPRDQLCPALPHDVSDFNASLVYTLIEKNAQDPFDVFSWQTFVALNWLEQGTLPWQSFDTPDSLFGMPPAAVCDEAEIESSGALRIRDHLQAQGLPLIDQAGNYVVYDVRIGPEVAAYIRDNGLNTNGGQRKFAADGEVVDYPRGRYQDPALRLGGTAGSTVIKSAWRIFDLADAPEDQQFLTRPGRLDISAERSANGRAACVPVILGLVGFHIMRRTTSGNGGDWIWTTFEHRDNAPLASNARGVNNIFATPLFADGCQAGEANRTYSFFDPDCRDCAVNQLVSPATAWRWFAETPFAGSDSPRPQVVKCWKPARSTESVNAIWQLALGGSVLANYALSTTQWKGAPMGGLFPAGEVPRYSTNTTMETYLQDNPAGSCLGCHAGATNATGQSGNFSFLLQRAQSPGTPVH